MNNSAYPELTDILSELSKETGCTDWKIAGRILPRRNSRVVFLESINFGISRIVIKIYPGKTKRNPIKLHERSQRYYQASEGSCTVPEPVALLPHGKALAVAFVAAPFAGQLLRHGFHANKTRERVVTMSARWLRWFHESGGMEDKPLDPEFFKSRLGRLTGEIHDHNPGLLERDPFLSRCLATADRVADEIGGRMIPHAPAHGDFTPYNVFIQGETAVGFDFDCQRDFPVTYDISRFLLYMDLHRVLPAPRGEIARFGCRKDDFDGFAKAYGVGWMDEALWLRLQFFEMVRRMTALKLKEAETNAATGFVRNLRLRRNAGLLLKALG